MALEGENSKDQFDDEAPPDEGNRMSCVIHRTFHVPRIEVESQRSNLFRTRGTIKGRVCDIIIDNGSTNSLISWKVVNKLGLTIENHTRPYSIS